MNVNKKGNITEIQVMLAAMKAGYTVSIPYGDCDRYDQIWEVDHKLLRIQVKTARSKNKDATAITFNCYSVANGKKHKYSSNDIDYFATYWNDTCYLIPVGECSTEKTLWFSLPDCGSGCCLAENYRLQLL